MKSFTHWLWISTTPAVLCGLALLLGSCATPAGKSAASAPAPAKKAPAGNVTAASSGAQLWAQNCGHCHNVRSPGSYSDAQWEVALLHMRVRANLTAEEHKDILAFMKSAH